ncbi:MAG TPA: NUDIX hydrolase [Ktedonobacteraceae bacterium]|nr:NUDIX hydrolase [Ktedonobacteraceae bacterium]
MSQDDQTVGTDLSRPPDVSSPYPAPKRPLSLGAGAVVVHDERVLLVRNKYGVTKGRYLLPAGRVNVGELPDRAAVRETFEETNLRVAIEGLLGIRIWVMDDGEHNYFFMFRARLLSSPEELQANLNEVDDARFFSKEEMDALTMDETWAGAIAVAYKALDPEAIAWPNGAELSSDSGVDTPDRWRIWL